jgi:hypothetical protein
VRGDRDGNEGVDAQPGCDGEPATKAVVAATAVKPRDAPLESAPERISGFNTTM